MGNNRNPSWHDVTEAKRKSTARMLVQAIWALMNATDMTNEDINNVLDYMRSYQDSFNKGYLNYKDVVKTIKEERGIDLSIVAKFL